MKKLLALFFLAASALEARAGNQPFLSVTEENDSLGNPFDNHQDRHYTQGLKIVAMAGEQQFVPVTTALDRWLPPWGIKVARRQLGWVIMGQSIYTPDDYMAVVPDPNDRPYAGWLYTGLVLQRSGHTGNGVPVADNWEVHVGVVGPEALGEEAQKEVHRHGFPAWIPQGWDYQLPTEFGAELRYGRAWRLTRWPRHFDFIPQLGASLGNVRTHLSVAGIVRLGWNLPADFGPTMIESPVTDYNGLHRDLPAFGGYVFAGVQGRAVARNLFLDGNTFRDSPSVDKENFVGDFLFGFSFHAWRHLEFRYTHLHRSREFATQNGEDRFGSITVRAVFDF